MTTTALPTGTWHLDTSATTVTIAAKKLGFLTVPADLTVISGTIEIGDQHQVSKVAIVANAASYSSTNDKRNEHIRSADFLDVTAYPTISFETETVAKSDGGYESKGTVTVKGKSSPLDVTIADVQIADDQASFTASGVIDRMAIGVDKFPTLVIGRELQLTVAAKAAKTS